MQKAQTSAPRLSDGKWTIADNSIVGKLSGFWCGIKGPPCNAEQPEHSNPAARQKTVMVRLADGNGHAPDWLP
jgi:hypothetical protein